MLFVTDYFLYAKGTAGSQKSVVPKGDEFHQWAAVFERSRDLC